MPDCDLLVVDDSSPDGTGDLAESMFAARPGYSVLRRTGPRGLGRSYVDGFQRALAEGYTQIVQMDADRSHDPAFIPAMLDAAQAADVVLGSRYVPGGGVRNWPLRRLALSVFANRYVAWLARLPVRDATSGFRCYTRQALLRIGVDRLLSNGYAFQIEMTYRAHLAGLSITEVPILSTERAEGRSKMTRAVILESVVMPWRLRSTRRDAGSRPATDT